MVSEESSSQSQVLKLIEEKEKIEKEIETHGLVLKNNNVGFDDLLVDSEGFPRNDIDVRSVRISRSKIVCLQNDLKMVMKAIDDGLGKYFSEKKDQPATSAQFRSPQSAAAVPMEVDLKPFLVVNLVTENSPGFDAGVNVHDMIMSFGSVNSDNFKDLSQIGELVKSSQNHPLKVKVRRNGNIIELILVPKVWSGQGLLGFKVAPIVN